MPGLFISNQFVCNLPSVDSISSLKKLICANTLLNDDEYYILTNGKKLSNIHGELTNDVQVMLKLNGGKGGFGSMLRAIGAQIEKTTNREACRDLSGRRLRDINEEKRLKNWIDAQAKREKEADDRKQEKLKRLCELPKHEFKDETYDKERSDLPERIEDAVTQGMNASIAESSGKRKINERSDGDKIKKKKRKLWIDSDLEDSSDEISDTDDEADSSDKSKATVMEEKPPKSPSNPGSSKEEMTDRNTV